MSVPDTLATARLPWEAADPYPFYEESRRRGGNVVWDDVAQSWLVLGHREAREVLGAQRWTSDPRANRTTAAPDRFFTAAMVESNMLFTDGRAHDRLRHAVRDVFSRMFVSQLSTGIDSLCAEAVFAFAIDEQFDAMTDIACPLPIAVVAAWLGLEPAQCDVLRDHSPAVVRLLSGITEPAVLDDGFAASSALIAEFLPAAADRRSHPRDDLLSYLATAPELSLDDVVITAILIAVAGHETTANMLGAAVIRLLTPEPDGTRLADCVDPHDPAVFTELLRLDSPVQAVARTATSPHRLAGKDIRCGDAVLICLAAANRDPCVYLAPAECRQGRPGPAPLTFGHGAHHCLGAALARLEVSIALRHVLARRPVLAGTPVWRDTPAIRGPETVPVRFTR